MTPAQTNAPPVVARETTMTDATRHPAALAAAVVLTTLLAACSTTSPTSESLSSSAMIGPDVAANTDTQPEPKYRRQIVDYPTMQSPGTIVVDPSNRFLYLVQGGGKALRYGVGVGRAGFEFSGTASIEDKKTWPRWTPTDDMIHRDPDLYRPWAKGMAGGPTNPLGARAMYLFKNGEDTLYRIHGTNDPESIGQAMSSGCIRMLNQDVTDLYDRVPKGAKVVVL